MLPALAISILATGVPQKDGLWVAAGIAVALLSFGLAGAGVAALVELGVRAAQALLLQ